MYGSHEFLFIDLAQLVELDERRNRRLAYANRADLIGFDEADIEDLAHRLRQQRRSHPAGGAASGDYDSPETFTIHVVPIAMSER